MTYRALEAPSLAKSFDEGIQNLRVVEKTRVPLNPNEVRIQVLAASVNYFDLLMLVGKYQIKPNFPLVPGSECAGVVIEIGGNVKQWKIKDKVIVMMALHCFAEEVVVDKSMIMPKPESLSYEEASGFGVGYSTAYHGLVHRGDLKKGETLLVTGAAGGMGMAAIQVGKELGATVIAAVSSLEKGEACKKVGADYVLTYDQMKVEVSKITKGKMVDVVYENCGGEIFDQCTRVMGGGGRLLVIGFASGIIPKFPINLALIKGFSLVGVRSGAEMKINPKMTQEMIKVLSSWASKPNSTFKPYVSSKILLDNSKTALEIVGNRKVTGKSVIVMNSKSKL